MPGAKLDTTMKTHIGAYPREDQDAMDSLLVHNYKRWQIDMQENIYYRPQTPDISSALLVLSHTFQAQNSGTQPER